MAHLKVHNYKGIGEMSWEIPEEEVILLTGDPGSGKTRILECLDLIKLCDCDQKDPFSVSFAIDTGEGFFLKKDRKFIGKTGYDFEIEGGTAFDGCQSVNIQVCYDDNLLPQLLQNPLVKEAQISLFTSLSLRLQKFLFYYNCIRDTKPGGFIAFDNFGEGLHPHSILVLLKCFRGYAQNKAITVILASHNLAVISEFQNHPNLIYSMKEGGPVSWDNLYDVPIFPTLGLGNKF